MRNKIRKWIQDEFLRHTSIMVIGIGLVNFFNLFYHLAIIRLLSVAEYGILNSLISITMIFSQFTIPFRPVLTRFLAACFARNEYAQVRLLLRRAIRDFGLISAGILIVFILFARPIAAYQQIENCSYIIMVGILICATTMAVIPTAFLWGSQRFKHLAFLTAFPAFLKLVVGIGLVWAGMGVSGALIGYNASPIFILIIGFILLNVIMRNYREIGRIDSRLSMIPIYKYFIPTGLALFSLMVLTSVDVILVKHFFSPIEAGFYSVAQMVGKILLFLPGAISIVVFPKAASAQARGVPSHHLLKKGLIISSLLCGLGILVCGLAPRFVLQLLTGKSNPESVELVFWFALAMSFYALAWLNIFYSLSIHNTRFIKYLMAFAAAETLCIYIYHPSLRSVLGFLNLFAFISFVTTLSLFKPAHRI